VNNAGNKMQLDGYCEELNLAFEHQGRQHYKKNFFIRTDEDLKKRQSLDEEKRNLCKQNNIILIEVPELEEILPLNKLQDFIITAAIQNNIKYFDKKNPIIGIDKMISLFNDGSISKNNCSIDLNKLNFLNKKWNKIDSIRI
jgi:hypothetical protein